MTTTNEGTQRDELAEIIHASRKPWVTNSEHSAMETEQADAILAAGYRKPRTITTGRELDALPAGAVVLGRDKVACQKEEALGLWDSPEGLVSTDFVALPAAVLWEPEAEVGA